MKLKTSFFNVAALRKNLARFAPCWGLYGIVLLLTALSRGNLDDAGFAEGMAVSTVVMVIVNFFYALLCAQLLFGDLYNSRMCNALHALPMRREGWFLTNVTSGLLFSLLPNTVITLLCMVICGEFWMIPMMWLCAVTLQFLFFFGVAVLSSYLVGHRFAMGMVYMIINGFSIILYWLVYSIFEPMLYGVTVPQEIFVDFCPVVKLCTFTYLDIHWLNMNAYWEITDGWGYLGLCAGLGIVAMTLALALYRKRNLEVAGDFAAIKFVGPVFLILYTICCGACCHGFFSLFMGDENEVFLFIGLAIGYFTGSMLLRRTVRVFRLKTFLGFGAVALAMILSVVVVRTDLLGIVRWMPQKEQLKSVSITTTGTSNYQSSRLVLTKDEDLKKILQIHQYGLEHQDAGGNGIADVCVTLTYTLKSGVTRERSYYVDVTAPCADYVRSYMSRPEMVLGAVYNQLDSYTLRQAEFYYETGFLVTDKESLQQLMDAILADCAAETLAQDWGFSGREQEHSWLTLEFYSQSGNYYYVDFHFTEKAENITAWQQAQIMD